MSQQESPGIIWEYYQRAKGVVDNYDLFLEKDKKNLKTNSLITTTGFTVLATQPIWGAMLWTGLTIANPVLTVSLLIASTAFAYKASRSGVKMLTSGIADSSVQCAITEHNYNKLSFGDNYLTKQLIAKLPWNKTNKKPQKLLQSSVKNVLPIHDGFKHVAVAKEANTNGSNDARKKRHQEMRKKRKENHEKTIINKQTMQ